jgi:hypothetical protein
MRAFKACCSNVAHAVEPMRAGPYRIRASDSMSNEYNSSTWGTVILLRERAH